MLAFCQDHGPTRNQCNLICDSYNTQYMPDTTLLAFGKLTDMYNTT